MAGQIYLKRGDSGEHVQQVQQRLTELGFSPGSTDGDFGRKTVEAVQAFQAYCQIDVTGQVDEDTWNAVFTAEPLQTITSDDPEGAPTADRLVEVCLQQVNDRYVLGTNADEDNPDEDEFDCAELISWACAQLGVEFPDYSVHQITTSHRAGLGLSLADAATCRGALLFRAAGHNGSQYNHVAISLGTGQDTIEAMGTKWGVVVGTIDGRFTDAGLIPGIQYT